MPGLTNSRNVGIATGISPRRLAEKVGFSSAGEIFTMGLSDAAGTAPNALQHCRNPKVGRASAPAVVHKDKRPTFSLPARLSDREHK